jgi:ankyrin repeat protein
MKCKFALQIYWQKVCGIFQSRLIVNEGVQVNARDSMGLTAMHLVATKGYNQWISVFAAAGADLNSKASGKTPLHIATEAGNLECVEQLLDAGANVRSRSVSS